MFLNKTLCSSASHSGDQWPTVTGLQSDHTGVVPAVFPSCWCSWTMCTGSTEDRAQAPIWIHPSARSSAHMLPPKNRWICTGRSWQLLYLKPHSVRVSVMWDGGGSRVSNAPPPHPYVLTHTHLKKNGQRSRKKKFEFELWPHPVCSGTLIISLTSWTEVSTEAWRDKPVTVVVFLLREFT